MNTKIFKATQKDARRISYLIHKNTDANPNRYTAEQIQAWKKYNTPTQIANQLNDRTVFCAKIGNRLVGTIALKAGMVLGFYVSPSYRGKGIGRTLLSHLETYARRQHLSKLHLTSSPSALRFYKNNGYKVVDDVVEVVNGVEFPETLMEKILK